MDARQIYDTLVCGWVADQWVVQLPNQDALGPLQRLGDTGFFVPVMLDSSGEPQIALPGATSGISFADATAPEVLALFAEHGAGYVAEIRVGVGGWWALWRNPNVALFALAHGDTAGAAVESAIDFLATSSTAVRGWLLGYVDGFPDLSASDMEVSVFGDVFDKDYGIGKGTEWVLKSAVPAERGPWQLRWSLRDDARRIAGAFVGEEVPGRWPVTLRDALEHVGEVSRAVSAAWRRQEAASDHIRVVPAASRFGSGGLTPRL